MNAPLFAIYQTELCLCVLVWLYRWLYWYLQLSVVPSVLVSWQSAYYCCLSSAQPQGTVNSWEMAFYHEKSDNKAWYFFWSICILHIKKTESIIIILYLKKVVVSVVGSFDGGCKHREHHLSDFKWVSRHNIIYEPCYSRSSLDSLVYWCLVFTVSNSWLSHHISVLGPLEQVYFNLCLLMLFVESDVGNWCLLNIERDLMVVSCSSPNCPPSLVGPVFTLRILSIHILIDSIY